MRAAEHANGEFFHSSEKIGPSRGSTLSKKSSMPIGCRAAQSAVPSEQTGAGMVLENLGVANITPQGINAAMTANVHHLEDRCSPCSGRREKAGAQGMAGE